MGTCVRLSLGKKSAAFRLTFTDGLPARSEIVVLVDDALEPSQSLLEILRAHQRDDNFTTIGATASLQVLATNPQLQLRAEELHMPQSQEQSLECAICHHPYADFQSLNVHYREHLAEDSLMCCQIHYRTLASFKEHLQTHEDQRAGLSKADVRCDVCPQSFASPKALAAHKRRHRSAVTDGDQSTSEGREVHVVVQQTEQRPLTIRELLAAKKREQRRKDQTMLSCASCSLTFSMSSKLGAHILKHHPELLQDRCPQCEKAFLSEDEVRRHILERHPVHFAYISEATPDSAIATQIACNYCDAAYSDPIEVIEHCKTVHPERLNSFECPNCAKKFSTEKRFMNHLAIKGHECGKRPSCAMCFKVFSSQNALQDHVRAMHPEGGEPERPWHCNICNESYATKPALRYHVKAKHGSERHSCDFCEKTFALPVQKIRHERRVHQGDQKRFACNLCTMGFFTSREFLQHLLNGHKVVPSVNEHGQAILPDGTIGPTMKYYACEYCPLTTYSRKGFIRHQIEHTGIWPFTCEVCGKGFSERFQAMKHVRVQHAITAEEAFECSLCPRVFASSDALGKHTEVHKSGGGELCTLCDKLYENQQSIENHMSMAHSVAGEQKPFCETCDRSFKSSISLWRHRALKHMKTERHRSRWFTHFKHQSIHWRTRLQTRRKHCDLRKCPYCGIMLGTQALFDVHIRRHRGVKLFPCPHCERSFTLVHSLRRHIAASHQGLRNAYTCGQCGSGYLTAMQLRKHDQKRHSYAGYRSSDELFAQQETSGVIFATSEASEVPQVMMESSACLLELDEMPTIANVVELDHSME